jgi:hypothetical protein
MIDPAVGYSIALGMAVLLSTSGLQKIRDFSLFSALLSAYRIVPGKFLRVVAMVVPCVEILLAGGLCVAPCRRGCLAAAATLLIGYGMAMGVNLHRGRDQLDCGCGTLRARRPIGRWMLWRNGVLAAASASCLVPWSTRPLQAVDGLTVLGCVATAMLVYATTGRLLGGLPWRPNA